MYCGGSVLNYLYSFSMYCSGVQQRNMSVQFGLVLDSLYSFDCIIIVYC